MFGLAKATALAALKFVTFGKLGGGAASTIGGAVSSTANTASKATTSLGDMLRNGVSAVSESIKKVVLTLTEIIGQGFATVAKGVGAGLTFIGQGLAGMLAPLAYPAVLVGLGAVTLAVIGLGAAMRLAAPFIEKLAPIAIAAIDGIASVYKKGIDRVFDLFGKIIDLDPGRVAKSAMSLGLLGPALVVFGGSVLAASTMLAAATPMLAAYTVVTSMLGGGAGASPLADLVSSTVNLFGGIDASSVRAASESLDATAGMLWSLTKALTVAGSSEAVAALTSGLRGIAAYVGVDTQASLEQSVVGVTSLITMLSKRFGPTMAGDLPALSAAVTTSAAVVAGYASLLANVSEASKLADAAGKAAPGLSDLAKPVAAAVADLSASSITVPGVSNLVTVRTEPNSEEVQQTRLLAEMVALLGQLLSQTVGATPQAEFARRRAVETLSTSDIMQGRYGGGLIT
jgi:hypothetical protein